ncbi:MAG: 4Fe-4S binding protein [Deltaproteobacteria bacterium]|nr:4Fe-4S binding protein [Deltaproteobacteria bacterium]
MARTLEPTDLRLRRARRLLLVRRTCVAGVLLIVAIAPALHAFGLFDTEVRGAPWSISVFGLEFLDPLASLSVLAARGWTTQVLVGALPALVLVALLGRFFCGWMCPYIPLIAASEGARALLKKVGVPLPDVKVPNGAAFVVLFVLLAASALFGVQLAGLIYPPSLIARSVYKAAMLGGAGGGATFLALAFVSDIVLGRALWCRALCPGGAIFRIVGRFSPVSVVRDPSKCTDCTVCDVVCRFEQSPMTDRTDSACERCARCVSSCPTGALELVMIGRRKR